MSDQAAKIVELCHQLHRLAGVTSTWLLAPSDHEVDLYVTVAGVDETALHDQIVVYRAVEHFLQAIRPDMDANDFAFNYSVVTDEELIGDPLIPVGAKQIA